MAKSILYDVLIVGAGPAGLVAAGWMARTGVRCLVVDKASSPPRSVHADGIESRTFEILNTFGLGNKIWSESNHTIEACLWIGTGDGQKRRRDSLPNAQQGLSRYQGATLAQGRVQQMLLDFIKSCDNVEVQYGAIPKSLKLEDMKNHGVEYPIRVDLQGPPTQDAVDSSIEDPGQDAGNMTARTVKARYFIGCDGAHSWVRSHYGPKLAETQERA